MLVEDGRVFVKLSVDRTSPINPTRATSRLAKPREAVLSLAEIIVESPDVRTFRFDNSQARLPLDYPGRFVKIRLPVVEPETWRSFTICSNPARPEMLDLTIKLNPQGTVSRHLFEHARPGQEFALSGPHGGFYFDHQQHDEPLVLISAGSGVTPMICMARWWQTHELSQPCTFIHGARTPDDILFYDECRRLAAHSPLFKYHVTLSQPDATWAGSRGRIDFELLRQCIVNLTANRYFLCGPGGFMEEVSAKLIEAGVSPDRIHTEQFQTTATALA